MVDTYFRVPLFLVRLSGISVNVRKVSRLSSAYNVISTVCFYVTYLSVIMDFVVKRDDIEETMKNVRMSFGMAVLSWMHFYLRSNKHEIEYLIHLTESFKPEDFPNRDPDTGNLTMTGYIPRVNKLTKYGWLFVAVFHAIQSALRMTLNRSMIFTTWYPFDASVSPVYEIVNLSQVFASILAISICVGFPGLYATLVCVACSQLEKLKGALLDIRQTHLTSQQDCGAETNGEEHPHTTEEVFRHEQKKLNDCIRHHQRIILYMTALEETINFALCGLFLLLLAALCFIAFSAVTSWGDLTDVSQALVMYCVMMSIVFVFCWLGTQLSVQAENVRDAAWGCDWVGTPVPFQRCLIFIIAAANKEFTLTAGKFVPVSNKTMMNMINQTVSFFMFLLHMKKKNEEPKQGE
ncbi:odorant receptor 2a-like [Zootermopsis nevadensis]|uniref:Odorant receptor n=1 Tax=Zootermopsis nevadensis TaxID=136037 RepID=A0A067R004_ZOONE|nr:odorant receptor 2a-like [Zootermopsis nevadensis]KDR15182.1 hypothetical protein L798_10954 [Zootermopsis nevadensis]